MCMVTSAAAQHVCFELLWLGRFHVPPTAVQLSQCVKNAALAGFGANIFRVADLQQKGFMLSQTKVQGTKRFHFPFSIFHMHESCYHETETSC